MTNRGKQFEKKFKEDFLKTTDGILLRLNDQMSGYKNSSSNVCDFIAYIYPNIYFLEIKTHKGNTWPFTCFSQYNKLEPFVNIKGIRVGVILWLIEKDKLFYLPVSTIKQMKQDDKKSFNIKDLSNYNIIEIPSVKKRVFLEGDYSILYNLKEGD